MGHFSGAMSLGENFDQDYLRSVRLLRADGEVPCVELHVGTTMCRIWNPSFAYRLERPGSFSAVQTEVVPSNLPARDRGRSPTPQRLLPTIPGSDDSPSPQTKSPRRKRQRSTSPAVQTEVVPSNLPARDRSRSPTPQRLLPAIPGSDDSPSSQTKSPTCKRPRSTSPESESRPSPKKARYEPKAESTSTVAQQVEEILTQTYGKKYFTGDNALPSPEDLSSHLPSYGKPNRNAVPATGGYNLNSFTLKLIWAEMHWKLSDDLKAIVKGVFSGDAVCKNRKDCKMIGTYCVCGRNFLKSPGSAYLWKHLAEEDCRHIFELCGLEPPVALNLLRKWKESTLELMKTEAGQQALDAIDAFSDRATQSCNKANVIAALCSPSTFLELLLVSSEDISKMVLTTGEATPYLKEKGDIKQLKNEKVDLISKGQKTGNAIYTELLPTYQALSNHRNLQPLSLASDLRKRRGALAANA